MLGELRRELCGDDGFRGKVKEYTNNPGSAPLLTGLIVSLVGIAGAHGLPIDPAIATIIVLYIVKIGLNTFCEYTEPETDPKLPAAEDEKGK
jgi:divalent metal cation (Fe/Co/Zn/Cd) transporter